MSEIMKDLRREALFLRKDISDMVFDADNHIDRLENENSELRKDNERLIRNASELMLSRLVYNDGCLEFDLETNPLLAAMSLWAWEMLIHNGGENFVTTTLRSKSTEEAIIITFRRATGKTVEEKYGEICREVERLKSNER